MPDYSIKQDKGKPRLALIPPEALWAIGKVRTYGVKKYGDSESWRKVKVERYRDALMRHIAAYLEDPQGLDEESGLMHIEHVICNAAFLVAQEYKLRNDNR